jgi:alpha-beta hydrolase superfamily lysophospholipase
MMVERRDVEFEVEGGDRLRGWLFVPENRSTRHPAISMAHGYAGVKEHGLELFARAFTEAGFVVLVHDHRNFGSSDGTIRHDIDPWRQIADWRRAISFLESLPEVEAARIGVWGTNCAGGHVLVLAATDRRIRAVVAQVRRSAAISRGCGACRPMLSPRWNTSSMTMSGRSSAASRPAASRWSAMIRQRRRPIDRGTPFPSISSRCHWVPG